MSTMTHPSPEIDSIPNNAGAPEDLAALPAPEFAVDTTVALGSGAAAGDGGEVLTDSAIESDVGDLADDVEPVLGVNVSGDDADLFGGQAESADDAVKTARTAVNEAIEVGSDEVATATGDGSGTDDPGNPKKPTGGDGEGEHEDGEGEDKSLAKRVEQFVTDAADKDVEHEAMRYAVRQERERFFHDVLPYRQAVTEQALSALSEVPPQEWLNCGHYIAGRWFFETQEYAADNSLLQHNLKIYAEIDSNRQPQEIRDATAWLREQHRKGSWKACPDELLGVRAEGRRSHRRIPEGPLREAIDTARYDHLIRAGQADRLNVFVDTTILGSNQRPRSSSVSVTLPGHGYDMDIYPICLKESTAQIDHLLGIFARRADHGIEAASYGQMLRRFVDEGTEPFDRLHEVNQWLLHAYPCDDPRNS